MEFHIGNTTQNSFLCQFHLRWVANAYPDSGGIWALEIQPDRPTEVCGKVLLLSNVIDVDHQNSCMFTNKGHFSSPLHVLIGVLAKCHE